MVYPRNTAAAICFCRFCFRSRSCFNCYPSDHIIGNADLYEESMQEAIDKEKEWLYSNLRYRAYKPETGYGYIERDGDNVLSFRETKSSFSENFIAKETFLWNSGMFFFQVFY
jgi:mannose-1-phosphate guanylyltransferase